MMLFDRPYHFSCLNARPSRDGQTDGWTDGIAITLPRYATSTRDEDSVSEINLLSFHMQLFTVVPCCINVCRSRSDCIVLPPTECR